MFCPALWKCVIVVCGVRSGCLLQEQILGGGEDMRVSGFAVDGLSTNVFLSLCCVWYCKIFIGINTLTNLSLLFTIIL